MYKYINAKDSLKVGMNGITPFIQKKGLKPLKL